jgi:hypothetical protein
MGTHPYYKPTGVVMADLEGDGMMEVLAGSTDNLFRVWRSNGTLVPGWPVDLGGPIQSKAAVGDIEGDGVLEIVVSTTTGQLWVLQYDGQVRPGWPQPSQVQFGFISPTLYDLDGDGILEILIPGGGQIHAWKPDGSIVPGFPVSAPGTLAGTLAVGDVTGDDAPEIFAVTSSGILYAFHADGTPVSGWPVDFGLSTSWAAPSIGDLEGDGDNEVLVVGYEFGSYTKIFAYHGDGSLVDGFPLLYASAQTYSCPVLADADGDGDLEIWNAGKVSGPSFYAWDHQGQVLPGWPTFPDANMEGSAILVDFDGDGIMEAAVADNLISGGYIHGYNLDGTLSDEFPILKEGASGPNSPEVGDVDGDGDLDMAMTTTSGYVYVWDFVTPYHPQIAEWGSLFHDDWNTNQHGFWVPSGPSAAPGTAGKETFLVGPAFPLPFRNGTRIRVALEHPTVVTVEVLDVTGRRVRRLHGGPLRAGQHLIAWDGRNERGREVPGGLYFLRVAAEGVGVRTIEALRIR